jgi:hypothetical protein
LVTCASEYPLCRHTKTNGLRCQSPALTDSAFCYHHQKLRRTRRTTVSSGPGLSTNVLHPLRNANTLLQATNMVLSGIATNQIHPKKAGRMLSALRLAAAELRRTSKE